MYSMKSINFPLKKVIKECVGANFGKTKKKYGFCGAKRINDINAALICLRLNLLFYFFIGHKAFDEIVEKFKKTEF